jgi:hypothetical protein
MMALLIYYLTCGAFYYGESIYYLTCGESISTLWTSTTTTLKSEHITSVTSLAMSVKELLTFTPGSSTPSRDGSSSSGGAPPHQQQRSGGQPDRSRKRLAAPSSSRDEGGILKKPLLSTGDSTTDSFLQPNGNNSRNGGGLSGSDLSQGLEISDEERLRILQMVEEEPEVRTKEFWICVVVEWSYRISK